MSDCNRVFITGLGTLTASGHSVEENWRAIVDGVSNIGPVQQFDLSSWGHNLAGEIKDYQPAKMLPDRKLAKVISRQDVLGIYAAVKAVEDSALVSYRDNLEDATEFNDMTGVYVGSPGNKYSQQDDFLPLLAKTKDDMRQFAGELFNEVHPMWLLRILPNNVLAYTGITYGFKGPNHNITNHAASGMQAIIEAYQAIKIGQIERAVVVAYDIIEPLGHFYYEKLGVLSTKSLKPFDKAQDGTVLAEGAAALVLESEASLKKRQARAYAEIKAGLTTTEAQGLFAIEKDGAHLALLMRDSLAEAKLQKDDIAMIVAHGNGNAKSDETEALAIKATFAEKEVPVTAFKWSMGHTICASAIVDTVLACKALEEKIIPGIATLENKSSHCENLNVTKNHRNLSDKTATMIVNRGFGSMNTILVIDACE
ncbi:MAG: 3-oxoacyl-ACP synthase [Proteobacteria bacterium]|nr:3-oxoacyl-ACP synthase [Pseudomonadota bacterium]